MKPLRFPLRSARRRAAAFSLVEIALALGIVGFALVGIVGAIPIAVNNERQSIAQTRAASVANVIFTNFRTQPFGAVQYLDIPVGGTPSPSDNLDLNSLKSSSTPIIFYAYFDETLPSTPSAVFDARRLHFLHPRDLGNVPPTVPRYEVVLHFDNNPVGTSAPYATASGSMRAQANAVAVTIFQTNAPITDANVFQTGSTDPAKFPKEVSRFSSVIANRL